MHNDNTLLRDEIRIQMDRPRSADDLLLLEGFVIAELFGPDGELKQRVATKNLITAVGDQMYAARGSGVGSPPAAPTGMRLGTGSTAVAKTGAGAALVTRLTNGHQGFDATFPTAVAGVVTYKTTYAAGKATSASAITEAVLVNDTIGTDTSTAAANTIARVILSGIAAKGADDTLALTWTHTLLAP